MSSVCAQQETLRLAQQAQAALIPKVRHAQQMKQEIEALLARAKNDPQARAALLALEAQTQGPWGKEQKHLLAALQQLAEQLPKPPAAKTLRRAIRPTFL
ncbi:hypothetical protein [Paludibacterium purpuratum]|uniref:Uncharacterized protein n=1 Tax=Paludibacterium purpuratum TaxID=1144873 RepID=A0A4R7B3P3_9NEIS|nr:hypothetical protein [Paludibacterium purpuratum]TDR76643.1 hypothetical protein DFP86_11069 [Paludibacterium purpuratum]